MLNHSIAEALDRILNRPQPRHTNIIRTEDLSRADRELLLRTGWLMEIIKGWYLLIKPDIKPGDSTPWYIHFWDFLAVYLEHRFQKNYCLSAESSIDILLEVPLLPRQTIAIVPFGGGKAKALPFDTSLLMYTDLQKIPEERIEKRGLQIMPLALALCRITPSYFRIYPKDAEIALRFVRDASELSQILIKYNFKTAAARLLGAYYFLNDHAMAKRLERDLQLVGWQINPENPFQQNTAPLLKTIRPISPYVARIEALWQGSRNDIIKTFEPPPRTLLSTEEYMKNVEEIYKSDAYNSLSIEGYKVTPELIERVRNNTWDPTQHPHDKEHKNALAARGYFEAFQAVKESIRKILSTQNIAGQIVEEDLQNWYQKLFTPSIQAGLLQPDQLLGYRKHPVYIRNARHVPPPMEAIMDAMEYLFKALQEEPEASVRAILGHYIFVFIHPYMDGNGRIARFLMNTMLASGGYSWVVVPLVKRQEYMNALASADLEQNLIPLSQFISHLFREYTYTFDDTAIVGAIKDIISKTGHSSNDFEILVSNVPNGVKKISLCHKKTRKCKQDFTISFPPHDHALVQKEIYQLFSNPEALKTTFLI